LHKPDDYVAFVNLMVDEIGCTCDVSALEGVCSDATKLIIVNFPRNPTGQMVSETAFRRIAQIARASEYPTRR
jgi:aspartate/methionine/tyrosine aminotransferase